MITRLFIRIIVNCGKNLSTQRIFAAMPIKDKDKAREYFKNYMANRRKGLTVKPTEEVKPIIVKPDLWRLFIDQVYY